MNITELDEWQGITAELVAKWLVVNGWQQTKPNWWDKGEDGFLFDSHVFDQQMFWLYALTAACGHDTPQALLREINPRMRKGMPSEAAREAHPGGLWLATPDFACIGAHVPVVVTFDGDGFGVWHPEGFALPDSKPKTAALWHFWPCDANGNKVRWPTDEEGNIL